MIPEDFILRDEKLENIMLCSANLQSNSRSLAKCSAVKKKSSGSFLGNVASSISSGFTQFFSGKPSQPQPQPQMMNMKMSMPSPAQLSRKR